MIVRFYEMLGDGKLNDMGYRCKPNFRPMVGEYILLRKWFCTAHDGSKSERMYCKFRVDEVVWQEESRDIVIAGEAIAKEGDAFMTVFMTRTTDSLAHNPLERNDNASG